MTNSNSLVRNTVANAKFPFATKLKVCHRHRKTNGHKKKRMSLRCIPKTPDSWWASDTKYLYLPDVSPCEWLKLLDVESIGKLHLCVGTLNRPAIPQNG